VNACKACCGVWVEPVDDVPDAAADPVAVVPVVDDAPKLDKALLIAWKKLLPGPELPLEDCVPVVEFWLFAGWLAKNCVYAIC
jgi:hypothetical protein